MYQYCPKCKRLIDETDVCPYCQTSLTDSHTQLKQKLSRKEIALYALGYILLAVIAFLGRDLTNMQELVEGTIIFGAFVGFSVLWFYFSARGGIGYPIR
ncbi:MAG: hypothetical protein V1710_09025 [Candidatus Bathyarchaeota archaeon]